MSQQAAASPPEPKPRRGRIIQILGVAVVCVLMLVGFAPSIVSHTGLRNSVITAIVAMPGVTVSCDEASLSWFSPLSVRGLRLADAKNQLDIRVQRIASQQSLLQLWLASTDLGAIEIEQPQLILDLPFDGQLPERQGGSLPNFTAVVKDARATVRMAGQEEPLIDVDDVDMTARVEKSEEGRIVSVDPVVLFDRRAVSAAKVNRLLRLFDPTIPDDSDISGEFTLALNELRVPLGLPYDEAKKKLTCEGRLVVHQISTAVTSQTGQALVRVVADLNGKQAATEAMHLARDTEILFQVRDGRLHHQELRIGLPDIDPSLQITSRGSIGLDQTLDLALELPRLDEALRQKKAPARCRVTGTLSNPRITVEDGSLVFRQPDRQEPMFAADGIDLDMQVETFPSGRVLVVKPVEVFKKRRLNLVAASGLLKLLSPDVAESQREVSGDISLAFSSLQIPLTTDRDEAAKQLHAEGTLTLHQIASHVQSPMWQALMTMLADINGQQPPRVHRLVADAEIPFQIRDGRLHHEGMRFGFPDIDEELVITTRGSIGLDETVDLHVDLPRLDKALRKDRKPAHCHITGTIANPRIHVEDGTFVLREQGREQPIIAVDGVDLDMLVEETDTGRVLVVAPVELFRNTKLNLAVVSGLLKLLAPDVAETERRVAGEITLAMTKVRVPIGVDGDQVLQKVEAEGTLTLHEVSAEVKSPMWQSLIRVIAEMNGKKTSNVIHLVEESEIHFRVADGRLYHAGQKIGFPEIDPDLVITSRGSIGLDESVDLDLEVPWLSKNKSGKDSVQCHVTGTIFQPSIAMQNGRLVVRLKDGDKAALSVDNVNLNFGLEETERGRMLTLAPVTLFENQRLTPELGEDLFHLIAPTLSDLASVQGEVSLSLETLRVPLGVGQSELEKGIEMSGRLQLHQISASTKTPLLQTMVKMVADMHGKPASEVVRVVENADVRFRVRNGRMYHEGLRLGFPEIAAELLVASKGSVGFDQTLDFELEVPGVLLDKKALEIKKAAPVRFRVTGTVDQPVVTEIKSDEKTTQLKEPT